MVFQNANIFKYLQVTCVESELTRRKNSWHLELQMANQWIFEPFDKEYVLSVLHGLVPAWNCCLHHLSKSYWIMILNTPSSVLTHLNVLSVPTDKANFPEGWIDRDVTCPLIKTKH